MIFLLNLHFEPRKSILRGWQTHFVPGLSPDIMPHFNNYSRRIVSILEENPFSEETIEADDNIMALLAEMEGYPGVK